MPRFLLSLFLLALPLLSQSFPRQANVVYILADDLGYGELGCYGQEKIETPNIDRLAAEGMRFTQHYAGAPVCAPSRCVLMTGVSSHRAPIRGNKPARPEGQVPLPRGYETIAGLMRAAGYATGAFGKWGLGPSGSAGDPNLRGFDLFHGYICQRQAHNYYPPHLWLNREKQLLNNRRFPPHQKLKGRPLEPANYHSHEYAPELILSSALAFVREHQDRPFFLYLPFVEPHLAMQPPQEWVDHYPKSWDEKPYEGTRGYLPHPRPRAGYAAMISDLDEHVGKVLALLDELGLRENTLVLFSSDNGPTHDVGGVDTKFFASAGGLRGRKGSVFEGGLRVPFIARWPGYIQAGSTSDHVSAFQDLMPTLADVAGLPHPRNCDGISYLPTLLGRGAQAEHAHLAWEFAGYGGQQAVRMGKWKGVRQRLHRRDSPWMLFDVESDRAEKRNVAKAHPEVVERIDALMKTTRRSAPMFPIKRLDGPR